MTLSEKISGAIWEKSGLDHNSPKAYYTLSLDIFEKTGERLGENTLKRVLGLLDDERAPHKHTLDTLARYLGYRNWNQLDSSMSPGDSGFAAKDGFLSAELTPGQRIVFTYAPDREVEIEYQGNSRYSVISSNGSSLKPGDMMEMGGLHCSFPLVASAVIRDGRDLGQYHAAEKLGIASIKLV